jgi:hypothetical protein
MTNIMIFQPPLEINHSETSQGFPCVFYMLKSCKTRKQGSKFIVKYALLKLFTSLLERHKSV